MQPRHIRTRMRSFAPGPSPFEMRGVNAMQATIHEQIQFPNDRGGAAAQRLRIVRIERSGVVVGDETPRKGTPEVPRAAAPNANVPSSAPGTGRPVQPGQMHLRPVGETVTDHAGNLYEVRDQHLRPLGEVVVDEEGHLFEVAHHPGSANLSDRQPQAGSVREQPTPGGRSPAAATTKRKRAASPAGNAAHSPSQMPVAKTVRSGRDPSLDEAPAEQSASQQRHIPRRYLHPSQFRYSREEVLYDMQTPLGTLSLTSGTLTCWLVIYPLRGLKIALTWLVSGRRVKKWRVMLKGKGAEAQLWQVPPPRGFAHHPMIRHWAAERLEWAGYEPNRMILEWEIYWRRKG